MTIKAKFFLASPDTADATLTMTAPIAYWRQLRAQLDEKWPSWDYGRMLADVIRHAEKHFDNGGESSA